MIEASDFMLKFSCTHGFKNWTSQRIGKGVVTSYIVQPGSDWWSNQWFCVCVSFHILYLEN